MIAIAAPTFDAPSETFIRDHVQAIAPDETALICFKEGLPGDFGGPSISGLRRGWKSAGPIHRRFMDGLINSWSARFRPGLSRPNQERLKRFLAETRPAAILAEYGPTGCHLMDICVQTQVPLFVHFHGYDANILPYTSPIAAHYRRLFELARGVLVTSDFLRERLLALGCPPEKLHICPCGVDAARFSPPIRRPPGRRLLMVSRLAPQKGPLFSIGSFARIAERHPDAILEIIGEGPLRAQAEATVHRLGLEERVIFHGAQSHDFVLSRLQAAHILLQHCISLPGQGVESLGLSLIEAMACGVAVVSTRHGAIPQTIEEGVTGLLVDERDVEGMAAAIASLLEDPARAEAMGKAGRRRVLENFTQRHARDRLRAIMGLPPLGRTAGGKAPAERAGSAGCEA